MLHFLIVYTETFTYGHHYSIPTQNPLIITANNSFVSINEYFYEYTSMSCIKAHPDFFYQDENLVSGIQDDFVSQLSQLQATLERFHSDFQSKLGRVWSNISTDHIAIFPIQTKIQTISERTDFTVLHENKLFNSASLSMCHGTIKQFP